VECACVRAQCPVRKAARKLLKTAPQSIDGKADDVSPMSPTTKPGPTVEGSLTKRNSVDNKKSLDLQVEIPAPVKVRYNALFESIEWAHCRCGVIFTCVFYYQDGTTLRYVVLRYNDWPTSGILTQIV